MSARVPKVRLRVRKPMLSDDNKMKLASAVEQFPEIWKLDHPRYKLRDSHGKSWETISQIMEIPGKFILNYLMQLLSNFCTQKVTRR